MTAVRPPREVLEDVPRRTPFDRQRASEFGASGGAALALVWAPFHLIGLNAPLGFVVCWFVAFCVIYAIVVRQRRGAVEFKDNLATLLISAGTFLALLPLILILYYLFRRGSSVVFAKFPSLPIVSKDLSHFGVRSPVTAGGFHHAIIGTFEQVGLATIVSVPLGVLTATYLNEIGGRFANVVRTVADALTGLPTIIAGLFVYSFWIYPRGEAGYSGFAASMALMIVMLPIVIRTSEEVLRLVSGHLREASLALGAPEWRTTLQVVIPTARTGLVTATILGVARAVGETAPVLLTAFGANATNWNLFRGPQADLPLAIYTLIFQPNTKAVDVAWGGALLLMMIVLTLFVLARILGTGGPGKRKLPRVAIPWRRS